MKISNTARAKLSKAILSSVLSVALAATMVFPFGAFAFADDEQAAASVEDVSADTVSDEVIYETIESEEAAEAAVAEPEEQFEAFEDHPNSWRYGGLSPQETQYSAWTTANGKDSYTYVNGSSQTRIAIDGVAALGIDVSEHNGTINWNQVKSAGVEWAIIRCGYGNNNCRNDYKWIDNVNGARAAGVSIGVYIYSYASSAAEGASEADHVLRALQEASISPSSLALPIYFDMEDSTLEGCSASTKAAIATAFCNKISAAGYEVGIYSGTYWWNNYLTDPAFNNPRWHRWVARYPWGGNTSQVSGTQIWQFSSHGTVPGISGWVDMNFDYIGYANNIGAAGVTVTGMNRHYTGTALKPSISLRLGGRALREGTDYTVTYGGSSSVPTAVGSYEVVVTARGSYTGSRSLGTMSIFNRLTNLEGKPLQLSPLANENVVLTTAAVSSGSNVTVSSVQNSPSCQRWTLVFEQSTGCYLVCLSGQSELLLDAAGSSPVRGANVSLYKRNSGFNQRWALAPLGDGYQLINAANATLVLDAAGATAPQGANVSAWTNNSGSNQVWRLQAGGSLSEATGTISDNQKNATGNALQPTATVSFAGQQLMANRDYTLTYNGSATAPSQPGAYTVAAEGIGEYGGSLQLGTFTIYDSGNLNIAVPCWVRNRANQNLVLDAEGVEPVRGATITAWSINNGSNQLWRFELGDDGYCVIRNVANASLVLDAAGIAPVRGASISGWTANGGRNQKWIAVPVGDTYRFVNVANPSLTLDAAGATPVSGAAVSAWTYNDGLNQFWEIVPANDVSAAAVSAVGMQRNETGAPLSPGISVTLMGQQLVRDRDFEVCYNGSTNTPRAAGSYLVTVVGVGSYRGTKNIGHFVINPAVTEGQSSYVVRSAANQNCVLDAAGPSPVRGSNVSAWAYNGGNNQRWTFQLGSDGYYTIRSVSDYQLVLDAEGVSPVCGSNVSVWTSNGGANQKWVIRQVATGHYVFISASNTNLVLDAAGTMPANGANISAWSANDGANQAWTLF